MSVNTPMERYRWETFWDKEPETIAWIDSFEPGSVFYDIGANVGVYSLYAASLDRGIKIYAFEPHEANNTALHFNRDYNRFGMQPEGHTAITILRYAVGDRIGKFCLEVPDQASGTSGAQLRAGVTDGQECECVTVDHFAAMWPAPDYVKIDIDGQEEAVVRGMVKTLPSLKSVLVEVSNKTKIYVGMLILLNGFTVYNHFNEMSPHSRERRAREGIDAENIIFTRR